MDASSVAPRTALLPTVSEVAESWYAEHGVPTALTPKPSTDADKLKDQKVRPHFVKCQTHSQSEAAPKGTPKGVSD